MPNIKDLFGNQQQSYKILSATDIDALTSSHDAESFGYIEAYQEEDKRFFPAVDYTHPKNFAKYGSAQEYYEASIKRIYRMYPYDGSHKEKIEWHNSSSYLDNYIFDNEYPRTNGYLQFGPDGSWNGGGATGAVTQGDEIYKIAASPQYISVKGGPNAASTLDLDDEIKSQTPDFKSKSGQSSYTSPIANIYDPNIRRASNLAMDGDRGNTVEFWVNLASPDLESNSLSVVWFDLWNGNSSDETAIGSASYGRYFIESRFDTADNLVDNANFHLTYMSGTAGALRVPLFRDRLWSILGSSVVGTWWHAAFSVKNSGLSGGDDELEIKTYVDGKLIETYLTGTSVGQVTGALNANVGAYRNYPTDAVKTAAIAAGVTDFNGYSSTTGSMDEFRFWKVRRNSQEIGRNWFTQVYGGTNSDDANTTLGVYYKFNEGVTDDNAFDSVALDYSGRISDGTIHNYTSGMRSAGSAIVLAGAAESEFKDPILYSFQTEVSNLLTNKKNIGYMHDISNNASIINSLPNWIVEDDLEVGGGNLQNLVQIVAQYFDNLQVMMDNLNHLKDVEYTKYCELTAIPYADGGSVYNNTSSVDPAYSASYSGKPLPFSKNLLSSVGVCVPDIFTDATALEALSSRDDYTTFQEKIFDVKNQIYQNIYNNLNYIFKSKGTEKAFRNLVRCYGVGEDLVKLNLYGDNITHKIRNNFRSVAAKKTYVDFNHTDRFSSTVYQMTSSIAPYSDNANRSYIARNNALSGGGYGLTFETEVLFPKKYPNGVDYQPYNSLTASLFGAYTADTSVAQSDTTWASPQVADFQVYAIKDVVETHREYDGDTYFWLTSSALGISLTSSLFDSVYDNNKWNFAVRIKPYKYPWVNTVTGAYPYSVDTRFEVSFYGVNADLDIISNEFSASAGVTNEIGNNFTSRDKRIYLGAERTNFTGTVLAQSDVKVSSTRVWLDYLTNDEIRAHARDAENHGVLHPYRNAFVFQGTSSGFYIPRSDLLMLEWDFSQITSSNAAGQFQFQDISSGSLEGNYAPGITDDRYGALRPILRQQFAGRGDLFPANDPNATQREYIYSAQQIPPEVINSSDMVNVLERDDVVFTKESLPIEYYIAVEKSMYQTISEEMLKMFATIQDFNTLIGKPVNRYRGQYKDMEKLKSLFYESIENSPDLDKYVDFYKWIDSSITMFLEQLFPASANYAKDMRTLVESHVLERNAYRNKFPTLEIKQEDPETSILGINELTYNWKYGHRAVPGGRQQENNCLWWNQRAKRDGPFLSQSVASVNIDRDKILHIATTENSGSYLKRVQGSTYVFRKLSRPYKEGVSLGKELHGGVNYARTKNRQYYRSKLNEIGADINISFDEEKIVTDPEGDCDDNNAIKFKQKLKFEMYSSDETDVHYKGNLISPFNLYLANPPATASTELHAQVDVVFVNLHSDTYGASNEIPMQTPFTEKYVGGNQYRHVGLNTSSLATALTRPEGFILDKRLQSMYGPGYQNLDQPRATHTREPVAKRPMNIKNIRQTTGSTVIGNYEKNYEVVQTSGRKINNKYFVEATGSGFGYIVAPQATVFHTFPAQRPLIPSPEIGFLRALTIAWAYPTLRTEDPFNIPVRTVYDSIFVERFSAPGSYEASSLGYLDPYAEEYSAYNALPFRNLTVRGPRFQKLQPSQTGFEFSSLPRVLMSASIWSTASLGLQSLLTRHCGWGGYDYELQTSGAYQKTNRNRLRMMESSSTGYSTGSQFDNWWVQHPIPRSDFNYAWITASVISTNPSNAFGFGYFPADGMVSSSAGGFESAVNFLSASEIMSYHNTSVTLRQAWEIPVGISPGAFPLNHYPTTFVGMNGNIYDPLTASNNTLGYPSGTALFTTDAVASAPAQYINRAFIPIWGSATEGALAAAAFNVLMLHRNGPYGWPSWKQIRAGETPVPRHHKKNNTFSISVRDAPQPWGLTVFPKMGGMSPLVRAGFDLSYKGLENASHKITNPKAISVANYTEPLITSKYFPMRHRLDTVDDNALSELVIDHTYTNNLARFANPHLDTKIQFALGVQGAPDQVYDKLINMYLDTTLPAGSNPIKGFRNLIYKEGVYPKAQNTYLAKTRGRTKYTQEPSVISGSSYTQSLGQQRTFWKDSLAHRQRRGDVARNALDYVIRSTNDLFPPDLGGLEYPRATALSIWPLDVGSRYLADDNACSRLSGSNHGQLSLNNTTVSLVLVETGAVGAVPTASFNYEYWNDILFKLPSNTPASFPRQSGDSIYAPLIPDWETAKLSGKSPWFNSYEDYAQDIRCFGKEYTVLPEFKISDHIDYYLNLQNFQAKNNKFLSLEGGSLSQSAPSPTSSLDEDFFNEYCHSDFLKHFEVIQERHEEVGIPTTQMTIKCHGIKKLLPYNGFYPMLRTVQLGSLFSQSFAPYLIGSNNYSSDPATERLASIMQPFFNPGILYNTIKSGIAVDWMAFTGSDAPSMAGTGSVFLESGSISSSFRFPFESLVDPGAYLPTYSLTSSTTVKDAAVYYTDTSNWWGAGGAIISGPHHVTGAYGIWRGNQKLNYTMAMQNFLGEASRFFLKGSKYKNIISGPEKKIKSFISGVTYYMDLVCYKTDDMVMYEGPQHLQTPVTLGSLNRQARGVHYGPICQITGSTPGQTLDITASQDNYLGKYRYDPSTAPYTPPYFYGKSVSTFAFKPHEAKWLDPFQESHDFDLEEIIGYLRDQGTIHYNEFDQDSSGLLLDSITGPTREGAADRIPRGVVVDTFKDSALAARTQMNNASSFNMFDITHVPQGDFDLKTGAPLTTNTNVEKYWNISPKFECPVLNFSGTDTTVTGVFPPAGGGYDVNTRGMWRGYGSTPRDGQGIFFEVRESFPTYTYAAAAAPTHKTVGGKPYDIPLSASLLQQLGFRSGMKQQIGEVSDTREIFEAVVAIPFKNVANQKVFFPILSADDPVMKKVLSRRVIEALLGNDEPLDSEIYTPGPSIVNMVETMQKYIFPPKLDFIANKNVTPFCMYIFEFGHTLDKQDLNDIWQGVMPKISLKAEKATATISHFLTNNELLGAGPIAKDLRWLVFKVKQKAEKSYYNVTISTSDDEKYRFDFDIGESTSGVTVPKYSYNWPYDFFSLVELAKIDAAVQIGGNVPYEVLQTKPDITDKFEPVPFGAVKVPAQGGPKMAIPAGAILVDDSGQGAPGYPEGQIPPGLDITKIGTIVAGQPSPMLNTGNQMLQQGTALVSKGLKTSGKNMGKYGSTTRKGEV